MNNFRVCDGVTHFEHPHIGIAEAHKRLVKLAKDNLWPKIMIAEDDIKFAAPGAFDFTCLKSVDAQGNVYVAEFNSSRISKITSSGIVSVFAGGNTYGYQDGNGSNALFYRPSGLYTDQQGNTFVTEGWGHRLRKITPSGTVTTVAGGPIQGYADGTGTAALFNNPFSVAVDPVTGNMYLSDLWNDKMRKVTPAGIVTTIQSNGQPHYIFRPLDVTIDENGTVYVGDSDNRIHCISTTTNEILILDEFRDQATNNLVTMSGIYGIAAAGNGVIYVADYYNNKIRKITGLK